MTPLICKRVHVQEKNCLGLVSKLTHNGNNMQKKLGPRVPPLPRGGSRVPGGGESKSKKALGDHFVSKIDEFARGRTSDIMLWGIL